MLALGIVTGNETMKSIAAREAKNGFGRLLDEARSEPIVIHKHGRAVAVVLSYEEYERLELLEDAFWAARAVAAEREGYLSASESEELLTDLLSAEY